MTTAARSISTAGLARRGPWRVLAAAAAMASAALWIALACGSTSCSAHGLWSALVGAGSSDAERLAHEVLWRLRLPRALAGFAVGGLLALAGTLLQVLLRNPLADPYVLGVSGGASFAAVLAIWAGASSAMLGAAAWVGALLSTVLLFAIGHGGSRRFDPSATASSVLPSRLLLCGVMLASGWTALITLVMTLAPDAELRGMLFWIVGELTGAEPWLASLLALAAGLILSLMLARSLNVLGAGDLRAQALGVDVRRLRWQVCLLAAGATAFAVTTAGAIGFVGLLVPHAARRFAGNDQRWLLPTAALAGGTLVVAADTLARTIVAPMQLPVGAILSLVGVPAFLWLLNRGTGAPR